MSIYTKDLIGNDPDNTIGDWTYGNPMVGRAYGGCKLEIGKFCSIGQGVQILFWGKHSMVDITRYPFNMLHQQGWKPVQCTEVLGEDVKIGNDIWIANNVTIHQGTVIGDGAVIGAHSVVKTIVEPYTLYVGNPAKRVRTLFPGVQIAKLLEMQWWNWPIEKIKEHLAIISSPNVDKLYEIWENEIK